jgi:hypothetical protein
MSGLTKKLIYADRNLSTVIGVREGDLVSYAEIQKGLHKYIKEKDLKSPQGRPQSAIMPAAQPTAEKERPPSQAGMKQCRDCGDSIPTEAVFCDLCGVSQ